VVAAVVATMVMLGTLAVLVELAVVAMVRQKVAKDLLVLQIQAAVVEDLVTDLVMVLALEVVLVFVSFSFVQMAMHQEFQNNLTILRK
jgi:hypothetical protein